MSRSQDILALVRSVQMIAEAGVKLQNNNVQRIWRNSSIRTILADNLPAPSKGANREANYEIPVQDKKGKAPQPPDSYAEALSDSVDRLSTVITGLRAFAGYRGDSGDKVVEKKGKELTPPQLEVAPRVRPRGATHTTPVDRTPPPTNAPPTKRSTVQPKFQSKPPPSNDLAITLTASDKALLRKLDMEHRRKMEEQAAQAADRERDRDAAGAARAANRNSYYEGVSDSEMVGASSDRDRASSSSPEVELPIGVTAVPNPKSKQTLNAASKQRTVPSTRVGRMVSFGGLAAGLGLGTIAEYTKRALGLRDGQPTDANPFMNQANMDRIVDTLCKVRGAALKIGQILSIQDDSIVNPQLSQALERVRKSADFMPLWQLDTVLSAELGPNWKCLLAEFENRPFAAASIGQVHWARTLEGREVAIKIQYPGVAKGIESDIDNLIGIMKVWDIFPPGMFVDNLVIVAKRELAWEVNYLREAECTKHFRELLSPYKEYYVPEVINNLSTKQVFTTEFIEGKPVDECVNLDQNTRNYICSKILELVLLEIMEFRYMQTDPNWANFFYNEKTNQIILLDFGASRTYSKEFMDTYVRVMKAAADCDREAVLQMSRKLGFLTGYESKIMEEAHVDAVMVLGDVFRSREAYDFSQQNTTERLQQLVPTMLTHRLCPPPEEIYSLHRKISGVFLLCAKLQAKIPVREMFDRLHSQYVFDT